MNYCWVTTHILAQCNDGGELLLFSTEGAKHVLQETNLQEGRELQTSEFVSLYTPSKKPIDAQKLYHAQYGQAVALHCWTT